MNITPNIQKLDNGSYHITALTKEEQLYWDAFFAGYAEFQRIYNPTYSIGLPYVYKEDSINAKDAIFTEPKED